MATAVLTIAYTKNVIKVVDAVIFAFFDRSLATSSRSTFDANQRLGAKLVRLERDRVEPGRPGCEDELGAVSREPLKPPETLPSRLGRRRFEEQGEEDRYRLLITSKLPKLPKLPKILVCASTDEIRCTLSQ